MWYGQLAQPTYLIYRTPDADVSTFRDLEIPGAVSYLVCGSRRNLCICTREGAASWIEKLGGGGEPSVEPIRIRPQAMLIRITHCQASVPTSLCS